MYLDAARPNERGRRREWSSAVRCMLLRGMRVPVPGKIGETKNVGDGELKWRALVWCGKFRRDGRGNLTVTDNGLRVAGGARPCRRPVAVAFTIDPPLGFTSCMSKPASGIRIESLRPGDLIFSTTNDWVSRAIRWVTSSRFSHASIYASDGVIIEANDGGVGPRKFVILGANERGDLVGLPYEEWTECTVLRLDPSTSSMQWEAAMLSALDDHLGLDFPRLSRMVRGGSPLARILWTPVAWLRDAIDWLLNKEPLAYDAWCSKLAGYVLIEKLGFKLNKPQRTSLESASPQRLYDLALKIGFQQVAAMEPCTSSADETAFAGQRQLQEAAFQEWKARATRQRDEVRKEKSVFLLRGISKWLTVVGLLFASALVLATGGVFLYLRNSQAAWETAATKPEPLTPLDANDACAYRGMRDIGWTENNKFVFCKVKQYDGYVNEGAYRNGGVCIRGPNTSACEAKFRSQPTPGFKCSPVGFETVCARSEL